MRQDEKRDYLPVIVFCFDVTETGQWKKEDDKNECMKEKQIRGAHHNGHDSKAA